MSHKQMRYVAHPVAKNICQQHFLMTV